MLFQTPNAIKNFFLITLIVYTIAALMIVWSFVAIMLIVLSAQCEAECYSGNKISSKFFSVHV